MAKRFTKEERMMLLEMNARGKSVKEISEALGRTTHAISNALYYYTKLNKKYVVKVYPSAEARAAGHGPITLEAREMTPREMIKALYDMGYRIENNQLVYYEKKIVKVGDIVEVA